jgi:hypothetical protein
MVDLGVTGPPPFPQKITFRATYTVTAEGLGWKEAQALIRDELMENGSQNLGTLFVTKLEIVEDE